MVGRRTRRGRAAARGWVTALTTVLALVLSGCQVLSLGAGSDVSENFEGEAAQELAQAVADGKRSTVRKLVEGGASLATTARTG